MKRITIEDLDFEQVLKQGKWKGIYGALMCGFVIWPILLVWNIVVMGGIQVVQLALVWFLDFITLDTIHFEGNPYGVNFRLKLLKKVEGDDEPYSMVFEKK